MPSFNFGARVGEVIGGALARGQRGRFANAADLSAARLKLFHQILDRLQRKAQAGGGKRSAARAKSKRKQMEEKKAKRDKNRADLINKLRGLGLTREAALVQPLINLKAGDMIPPDELAALVEIGMVKIGRDGAPAITPMGNKLVRAANREKTKQAVDAINRGRQAVTKSLSTFGASVRGAMRGLWAGDLDIVDFIQAMESAIDRGYEQAWREGAGVCGIRPDERTPEESRRLAEFTTDAKIYIFGVGEWIEARARDQGGAWGPVASRVGLWANRYNEVKAQAQTMACENQKLRWELGRAEHCRTCQKLAGRVMRASRWAELDVYPQDTRVGKLECRGFNCKCSLVPTTDRATPGRLPSLP